MLQDTIIKFTALAGIDALSAPVGTRVVRVTYKEGKKDGVKTGVKRTSLGAFVPALSPTMMRGLLENPIVKGWVQGKVEAVQDSLMRTALDSLDDAMHRNGKEVIAPSYEAILAAITREVEGSSAVRLSGETIKAWFIDSGIASVLAATFAAKLSLPEGDVKVRKVVQAYSDNFQLLAGKSLLPEAVGVNIVKALDLVEGTMDGADGVMYAKLVERVEVLTISAEDMLGL